MKEIEEQLREKTVTMGQSPNIDNYVKLSDVLAIVGKYKSPSEIEELINKYWKFDDNQQHLSTWHDKQELLEIINAPSPLAETELLNTEEMLGKSSGTAKPIILSPRKATQAEEGRLKIKAKEE
jgi:hypothetical protein